MKPLLFSLFDSSEIARRLQEVLQVDVGDVTFHRFPDTEWYLKINSEVNNRSLMVVDSLNEPDEKILPLLFFAKTAKELGARKVGLIAPYLSYLRQDKRFHQGEGITSRYFAQMLSSSFDWLMSIDPHLHRYHSLDEIYSIPTFVLHATSMIATWIKHHVPKPILIGPDMESEQWVADIAEKGSFPYAILEKIRRGDKEVAISMPFIPELESSTPVLVDDIISTARTMIETVKQLQQTGVKSVICIGVHALFAKEAYSLLSGIKGVQTITCNTIRHATNAIDVSDLIVEILVKNKFAKVLKK
ncbi:TPA: ribose-phosphate diphosphokinase [Legionella pneumophila subsp. pneumophila]|uniref:ribose-phosphate pyrophosphokinase n=1 Tax=Legionella pneumophila TaxID=446 RepID=UPI0007709930|nr:ribose-phosphate pyrophosphokinase [Legionella pneumophila]MCH9059073.1 ribose-phosphate pyrophosphokinase [Legionella pneumophila serogroup 1]MCH9062783.1 ribose-phosphate pyrophosphokinase [Legionella pneumophila serogroup 1]MCH9065105.1 ribose-phosphate pyrophosphokinase [Legionella pneumophila serogroup 1]MCH9069836.1 ribose-phosphate pyrophosphokinase [Legionella pneumophila serogroup 1]MCH9071081.1 ribose-phosphate pyrophosphokinase [Legionella pneumophila serogroup 1]